MSAKSKEIVSRMSTAQKAKVMALMQCGKETNTQFFENWLACDKTIGCKWKSYMSLFGWHYSEFEQIFIIDLIDKLFYTNQTGLELAAKMCSAEYFEKHFKPIPADLKEFYANLVNDIKTKLKEDKINEEHRRLFGVHFNAESAYKLALSRKKLGNATFACNFYDEARIGYLCAIKIIKNGNNGTVANLDSKSKKLLAALFYNVACCFLKKNQSNEVLVYCNMELKFD